VDWGERNVAEAVAGGPLPARRKRSSALMTPAT
jgi:hypothetical protein